MGAPGRLTAGSIAAAALTAAESGPLTMRAVAQEVGCDPMALYRHFPNRAALVDAVADLALADVEVPVDIGAWDDRIVELHSRMRAAVVRRPGLAGEFVARPPLGEHATRIIKATALALKEAGASKRQVVGAVQAMQSYLGANIAQAVAPEDQAARAAEVGAAVGPVAARHLLANGSDELLRFGIRLIAHGAVTAGRRRGGT